MLLRATSSVTLIATRAALRRHQLGALSALARHARWFSLESTPVVSSDGSSKESALLPEHIKFRMPDLDFEHISGGNAAVTLTKWHVKEGDAIKDGAKLCEIDTPDLNLVLEAGDEGFIAKIFVQEATKNVTPNQPLLAIVSGKDDIEPFVNALRANPRAIEGYLHPETAPSDDKDDDLPAGSDVLRKLQQLQKDGHFDNYDKQLKVLKSLARKNDAQVLVTFRGAFAKGKNDKELDDETFDADFFMENALELADEAIEDAAEAASKEKDDKSDDK